MILTLITFTPVKKSKRNKLNCPWYHKSKNKRNNKRLKIQTNQANYSKRLCLKFQCLMSHSLINKKRTMSKTSPSSKIVQNMTLQLLTWVNMISITNWTWCTTMNIYSLTHQKKKKMGIMKLISTHKAWSNCSKIQIGRRQLTTLKNGVQIQTTYLVSN